MKIYYIKDPNEVEKEISFFHVFENQEEGSYYVGTLIDIYKNGLVDVYPTTMLSKEIINPEEWREVTSVELEILRKRSGDFLLDFGIDVKNIIENWKEKIIEK